MAVDRILKGYMEKESIAWIPLILGAAALPGIYSGVKSMFEGYKKRDTGKMLGGALEAGISAATAGVGGPTGSIIGKGVGKAMGAVGSKAVGAVAGKGAAAAAGQGMANLGAKTIGGMSVGRIGVGAADIGGTMTGYGVAESLKGDDGQQQSTAMQGGMMGGMGASLPGNAAGNSGMGQNQGRHATPFSGGQFMHGQGTPKPFNFHPVSPYQEQLAQR